MVNILDNMSDPSSPTMLHLPGLEAGVNYSNLIVNYIPPKITEEELRRLFEREGDVESVKIPKDRVSGQCRGYAFVKYARTYDASRAISNLNGYRLENKRLKVSVARPSTPDIKDANLYVSGIPKHITQAHLEGIFSPYGTIVNCNILTDGDGNSRGVGFVRFNMRCEADKAVQHLNKHLLHDATTPLQVKFADKPSHQNTVHGLYEEFNKMLALHQCDPMLHNPDVVSILQQYFPVVADQIKTQKTQEGFTLYVYNLPPETDHTFLYNLFGQYGKVLSVRPMINFNTQRCKGYAFVNFARYDAAYAAIRSLNGQMLFGKPLQVSFKT